MAGRTPPRPPSPFPGSLANAAAGGPADLLRAARDLQLALERNVRGADLLARAAETRGGQNYASRMYEKSLYADTYQSRAAAASFSGQSAYLGTQHGQSTYLESKRAEDMASAAESTLGKRHAEMEHRRIQTPEYRAATAARVGAESAGSLNELRAKAEEARARTAHNATPEGRSEAIERAKLSQASSAHERRQGIEQSNAANVAAHGPVMGGAMNLAQGFGRLMGAMTPYTAAVAAGVGAVAAFSASAMSLAAAASPASAQTFSASLDLAQTRLGKGFIPALDAASGAVQMLSGTMANLMDMKTLPGGGGKGMSINDVLLAGAGAMTVLASSTNLMMGGKPSDAAPLHDLDPRLQSKTYSSFEAYGRAPSGRPGCR